MTEIIGYCPPRKRSLKSRIRRRARELSLLAYGRYVAMLTKELNEGKLAEDRIDWWEPAQFDVAMMRHQLLEANDALRAAISSAQILFP